MESNKFVEADTPVSICVETFDRLGYKLIPNKEGAYTTLDGRKFDIVLVS